MFKIENEYLIWGDCKYKIPHYLVHKKVYKIFGTATAGLARKIGILSSFKGQSGEVQTDIGPIAGRIIGQISEGTIVFLREQLDPKTNNSFWLISEKQIESDINFIIIMYDDTTKFILCPFTMDYDVT
jgi:hypothetical protein